MIASCANDGKIFLSHAKTGKDMTELSRKTTHQKYGFLSVSFSSTSEYLASGSDDGQIMMWDIRKREFMFSACHSRLD